jgi:hypothetical protein
VPKHWLLGGWYPWGRIDHQQRYQLSDSNKNVIINGEKTYHTEEQNLIEKS